MASAPAYKIIDHTYDVVVVGAGVNAATIEIERREVVLTFAPEGTLKDIERFTRTTRSGHMSGPAPQ